VTQQRFTGKVALITGGGTGIGAGQTLAKQVYGEPVGA
jgi:short-subunit dehydrogenase involved in D-alanine esterification of teichoic acids